VTDDKEIETCGRHPDELPTMDDKPATRRRECLEAIGQTYGSLFTQFRADQFEGAGEASDAVNAIALRQGLDWLLCLRGIGGRRAHMLPARA
jgi:hypothetical protein